MKQIFILALAAIGVSSGFAHNAHYYSTRPEAITSAAKQCPEKAPSASVSCAQLQEIAMHLNALADELRANPQLYGQKIIALQSEAAKQRALPQSNSHALQQDLKERLAIVRWLESPEG